MAIHAQVNSSSTVLATPAVSSTKNDDCYFYYYSSCTKGKQCAFRHEPAALRNETMCRFWMLGNCSKPNCIFRHMEISRPRNKVPCFFESQPGGCKKVHCSFMHNNVLDQPREEDKAKNPDIILPLAGSQSSSDDDHSCSSLPHVSRSYFTPINRRSSSSVLLRSRSPSRSPTFPQMPLPHPPVIVTVEDLESDHECDSPRKSWKPKPSFTEVYQDPVRTREREEEMNMLQKILEEQGQRLGYIFGADDEEEQCAHANGGFGNIVPLFIDEIEEFDVVDEEVENILPPTCSPSSMSGTIVSRIGTVIGNRVERNVLVQPSPVKVAAASRQDSHHRKKTAPSSPTSHNHVSSTTSPGSHHHRHHVSSSTSLGSHHHRTESNEISSSHRSSPSTLSWSPSATDSNLHRPSKSGSSSRYTNETSDVLRPGGGGRKLRRGGLAGALIADALGNANSSKYSGSSKRGRDDRDRHERNISNSDRHREGNSIEVHRRTSERNDRYHGSSRLDASERTYKRSLPREFTPERDTNNKRVRSEVHRHNDHHLNNISNGIDKSSSFRSAGTSSRHVREVYDDRSSRKISLHERFTVSDGSDLTNNIILNSSAHESRSARFSASTTQDREHARNPESSSSRTVRTRIDFSSRRSRSRTPEKNEFKIKSLSEIRKEKAKKCAAQTSDSLKSDNRNCSGLKRKRSPVSFDNSEDLNCRNSKTISTKRLRLDPEAAPFVPSSVHRRIVDVKSSRDSAAHTKSVVSVDTKSSSRKTGRIVKSLAPSLDVSSPSLSVSTSGQSSASSKSVEDYEEELLLTQYDEVDYEIDDIDESLL